MSVFLVCVLLLLTLTFPLIAEGLDDCNSTSCREGGPLIQFPFRHKHSQPQHCGYPGFDLYCDEKRETVLVLPISVKVYVENIDYLSQMLHFSYPGNCLPQNLRNLTLSASPFNFTTRDLDDYVLLNCSAPRRYSYGIPIPCLGVTGYEVYAVGNSTFMYLDYFTSCTKIYGILPVPSYIFFTNSLQLTWYEPDCSKCERQGKSCSLRNNTGGNQIKCTENPNTMQDESNRPLITGATIGPFLLVAALGAIYYIYSSIRTHKRNLAKIESFLEDYKALKPARFSYSDISIELETHGTEYFAAELQ